MIIIDIEQLVEILENLVDAGWGIPLSNRVAIEHDAFLDIVDQIRMTLRTSLLRAQEIMDQEDMIIAQARQQAAQTLAVARQESTEILNDHALRVRAQREATEILAQAQAEAEAQRAGADRYAEAERRALDKELERLHHVVVNGIQTLQQRRQSKQAAQPNGDEDIPPSVPDPHTPEA